jgi:hypothetical protein
MPKTPRVNNEELLKAGLEIMEQNGKPLTKLKSPGRSMQYRLADGETVRVRTTNDHVLITLADREADDARLNIEGTDWLLIVMPEIERTPGNILAYFVPTNDAVAAARQARQGWLATNPNTKGNNRAWNLWFGKKRTSTPYNDFFTKWSQYRLRNDGTLAQPVGVAQHADPADIKAEVERARQRIAAAAGIPSDAVKITIQFGI